MLFDASQSDLNKIITPGSGICIIGSGLGGGSLAMELCHADIPVVIIEAGGMQGSSGIVEKDNIGRPFFLGSPTTSIEVGGTSNLWDGVLAPLDKSDFEKKDWIPHSGWPIQYHDLEPYYRKAGYILGLADCGFFDPDALPDRFKQLLSDLSFDRNVLKNKLFQQPKPPVAFKDKLKRIGEHSDTFHCYYNFCALKLVESNAGRIEKLIAGKHNGDVVEVYADTFVVCAGALETPRLLLNSRIHNDNIGGFLMDHPMGSLCQVSFRDKQKTHIYSSVELTRTSRIKSGLRMNEEIQKKERLPNHCFYVSPSFSKGMDNKTEEIKISLRKFRTGNFSSTDIWTAIGNLSIAAKIVAYKHSFRVTYKYSDLFFVTEQIPNPNSTVTLSEKKDRFGYSIAKVNWQLTEEDFSALRRHVAILKELAFPRKHYKRIDVLNDLEWKDRFTSAAHHLGTARMADSPVNGVVDKNLKVFGIDNLYVCDGSAFPTSGNANCSFTISALACRLADWLNKKT